MDGPWRKEERGNFHKFRFHLLIDRKQQDRAQFRREPDNTQSPISSNHQRCFFFLYLFCVFFSPKNEMFLKKVHRTFASHMKKRITKKIDYENLLLALSCMETICQNEFFCFDQQLTCWEIKRQQEDISKGISVGFRPVPTPSLLRRSKCKLVLVKLFSKFIYLATGTDFRIFPSPSPLLVPWQIKDDGKSACARENLITQNFTRMLCTESKRDIVPAMAHSNGEGNRSNITSSLNPFI